MKKTLLPVLCLAVPVAFGLVVAKALDPAQAVLAGAVEMARLFFWLMAYLAGGILLAGACYGLAMGILGRRPPDAGALRRFMSRTNGKGRRS